MIGFLSFLLSLIILGLFTGVFKKSTYVDEDDTFQTTGVIKAVVVFIASLLVGIFQPIAVQQIDAGNVGLKIDRIGNSKGIPVARPCKGWVFYNSWTTDVVEYSIRQNHVSYEPFTVTTKGGFPMKVAPSFNYALKPDKASELYINLLKGNDFASLKDNFMSTATNLALNNASNKYAIDSIFNNKEGYNQAVSEELNRELSAYFFVTQINPGSVAPPELASVIQAKTETIQKAQQAELDKITANAEAETKIAKARGDSAALVIDAKAKAEAINKQREVLTPEYIDYIRWSRWDGKLPTTTLGSGTNVLLSK